MQVTSIFSSFHNVFSLFKDNITDLSHLDVSVANAKVEDSLQRLVFSKHWLIQLQDIG